MSSDALQVEFGYANSMAKSEERIRTDATKFVFILSTKLKKGIKAQVEVGTV
ncbi:MAG: hypothetical protein KME21_02090 [Desmonostoc vinosum HA7617-LM4]|jgi:hypothetical protein|nr:hypothetical protein [Desmonostoc vinosum HA7617-LM4]